MLHMASINDAMAQLEAEVWEINCKRQALQAEKNKLEEEAAKLKVQLEWNAKHRAVMLGRVYFNCFTPVFASRLFL
jgi:chromosome segregation ATPase